MEGTEKSISRGTNFEPNSKPSIVYPCYFVPYSMSKHAFKGVLHVMEAKLTHILTRKYFLGRQVNSTKMGVGGGPLMLGLRCLGTIGYEKILTSQENMFSHVLEHVDHSGIFFWGTFYFSVIRVR